MHNIIKTPLTLSIETKNIKNKVKKGFTLVEIMIVIAIIALLAAVAVPGLLRARVTARAATVQANLKAISTSIENFVSANNGIYPTDEANLTNPVSGPRYLSRSYCNAGAPVSGYVYTCVWGEGYTVTARPTSCTVVGTESYNITTGGLLSAEPVCQEAS
jgi:type II secretion system protein G